MTVGPTAPLGALGARFDVLALAGEGGMGRVYRARERTSGRIVALKVLPEGGGDLARFRREAEVLAALDLPGVVRHIEHGESEDGKPFLVMEWLAGHDLGDRLLRGPLSIADTLILARQAAAALADAHAAGVVHRDLKPGNLFLVDGRMDNVKIVDFGLARPLDDPSLTSSRNLIGTPAYMPPEQVRGDEVDARADVYALGAVLFHAATGRLPFVGAHLVATLAKVMVEDAPRLSTLCDAPSDLEDLVARMLAKDPRARPADGAALLEALGRVGEAPGPRVATPSAITAREQRVECVILCGGASHEDATMPTAVFAAHEDRIRREVAELGGAIEALAKGAWLVTIHGAASPAEQSLRAARCGLLLRDARPSAPIVIATGRVVAGAGQQVGEAIDRAALALVAAREQASRGVLIDQATAAMLDDRFRIQPGDVFHELLGEEEADSPIRTLLGRVPPCFGRELPLGTLDAAASAAFEEPSARLALITAAPGMGKSRLVAELLRSRIRGHSDTDVLAVRGEGQRATSSFGVVGRILRAAAHVGPGLHPDEAGRAVRLVVSGDLDGSDPEAGEVLGRLARVAAPEPGGPASGRVEPNVAADVTLRAFSAWLSSRAARRPTILVVEDAHWADAASLKLLAAAIDASGDRPLFVVATARPDAQTALRETLQPALELNLGPLSPRAAERLVRAALGDGLESEAVAQILARGAGHPFMLEELIRAFAEGKGPQALPDSVLGMLQARLDGADATVRRVLRAASVFGDGFTPAGVTALLGTEVDRVAVERALAELVQLEMVVRRRTPGGEELGFAHDLVREAAYAMLEASDRRLAHRLAGDWLEATGEVEPTVLAEHFHSAGEDTRAGPLHALAARVALERGDFAATIHEAERALACAPEGAARGALLALHAAALYWSGQLTAAAERAELAAAEASMAGEAWFEAVAVAIGSWGQLGRNEDVARWLALAAARPAPAAAREAQLVALSRGALQLLWAHHEVDLGPVIARVTAPGADASDYAAGWVQRLEGETAWVLSREVDRCAKGLARSAAAFTRAGAARDACLVQLNLASLASWAGDTARARALLSTAQVEAGRQGRGFLAAYAAMVEAFVLVFAGASGAEEALLAVLPRVGGGPRFAFLCRIALSKLARERADAEAARAHGEAAKRLVVAAELAPAADAALALALLDLGQAPQALVLAEAAREASLLTRDLDLLEGLTAVALARARSATGDREGAKRVAREAYARLGAIAATIPTAEARAAFWAQQLVHGDVEALAAAR